MAYKTKGNLKRPDEGGVFWKYLLWLWVWSRLTNWHSSTSDSSGMSVLKTESIYWTKTSRVSQLISWGIFSIQKKICAYQVMATTSNFKFDSIKEIFDLSNGMFLTVNNIFNQSVKSSFKNELLPLRDPHTCFQVMKPSLQLHESQYCLTRSPVLVSANHLQNYKQCRLSKTSHHC